LPASFGIEENYNLASYNAGRLLVFDWLAKGMCQWVELDMRQKEHVGDKGVQ
jgi:hypothetical protein